MTQRLFAYGLLIVAVSCDPRPGFGQTMVGQMLPPPKGPGVEASPPGIQLPLPPQENADASSPTSPVSAAQPPIPEVPPEPKLPAPPGIRDPAARFKKVEEQGYPDNAFGNGHWLWSRWPYGTRIAPAYEYPGLGGGPQVTYPWGSPGYTGRNDERSLNKRWRLWGPPVPVYTPVPEATDPGKLIYPGRNISSPGFIYGWVGPFPASPRFRNYSVDSWANPNADLSTGRPGSGKQNEMQKPPGTGEKIVPMGMGEDKKSVGYMTLQVKVPHPTAEVFVDGVKTAQTGTNRTFSSPDLEAGKEFRYEVTVRWLEKGVTYEQKKVVIGTSGEVIPLDFTTPEVIRVSR